jgi:hypothetical protein
MWWVMQETTLPGTCPSLSLQKVTSAAVNAALIRPGATPYALGGDWAPNAPTCNVDHGCKIIPVCSLFIGLQH